MWNEPLINPNTGKPWTANARSRHWVSNGDGYDPNEEKLLGQRVVFVAGSKVQAVGILRMVRAATRGNITLAVVFKCLRADGKTVTREVPIWEHRDKRGEFSIELADDYQVEQAVWLAKRMVIS